MQQDPPPQGIVDCDIKAPTLKESVDLTIKILCCRSPVAWWMFNSLKPPSQEVNYVKSRHT